VLPELTGEDDADAGRWSGCRGAGCGAGAELPLAVGLFSDAAYPPPALRGQLPPHVLSSPPRRPCRTPRLRRRRPPRLPPPWASLPVRGQFWACKLSMDAAGLKDRKVGPSAHCNKKKAHISPRRIGSSSLLRFKRFSGSCQSELRLTRVLLS